MPEEQGEDGAAIVQSTSPLSLQDKALIKFGEDLLTNSIDTVRDFAKTMITLVTGLFAVYFAILKFLGADNVGEPKVQSILGIIGIPPILLIVSLVFFALTVFPLVASVSVDSPDSIRAVRKRLLVSKFIFSSIGMSIFLISMYEIFVVSSKLLTG